MKLPLIHTMVNATSFAAAAEEVKNWAREGKSRYVCIANVHVLMEAHDSIDFRNAVNSSGLETPDGMPLVWMLRLKDVKGQTRVYGPPLVLHVLKMAADEQIPVGFYGADPSTLETLVSRMSQQFPRLHVVYAFSPPFRVWGKEESSKITEEMIRSGARILFIGLGCPKQGRWMAEHSGEIPAVMLGVGAAFDFHAGLKPHAPKWMQRAGLEWFFRLAQESGRLWRRYLYHNPRFLF